MSTTSPVPGLFDLWIDDAAVFPPGSSPVDVAWADHLDLRSRGYDAWLGPLLIGASGAARLGEVASASPAPSGLAPVGVSVIARAGTDVEDLVRAVQTLTSVEGVAVTGVEVAHDGAGSWRRALDLGLSVAVEVARGKAGDAALAELSGVAGRVVAKLRTQATDTAPAPSPVELAHFLAGAQGRGLPLKLTGGLHRAVRHGDGDGAEHGALNTLLAVHRLVGGGSAADAVEVLEERDGAALARATSSLTADQARSVRETYRSFGCCGVTDPLGDLAALGLLTLP